MNDASNEKIKSGIKRDFEPIDLMAIYEKVKRRKEQENDNTGSL